MRGLCRPCDTCSMTQLSLRAQGCLVLTLLGTNPAVAADTTRGSTAPRTLGGIHSPTLELHTSRREGAWFLLGIGGDAADFPVVGRCRLPSPAATASFNGKSLVRMRGVYRGGDLAYDRDCMIEFGFPPLSESRGSHTIPIAGALPGPLPASAVTTSRAVIEVREKSVVWSWEIPDLFTPRSVTVKSPSAGSVSRGQEVVLAWSPASDSLGPGSVVELKTQDGAATKTLSAKATKNYLTIVLPRDLPAAFDGPVLLVAEPKAIAGIGKCPVATCSLDMSDRFEATTTITLQH